MVITMSRNEVYRKLQKYFEIQALIYKLKEEAEEIKEQLRELGVGVNEPEFFEVPDVGTVKISTKKVVRGTIDRDKLKKIAPGIFDEVLKTKEIQVYEIRKILNGSKVKEHNSASF